MFPLAGTQDLFPALGSSYVSHPEGLGRCVVTQRCCGPRPLLLHRHLAFSAPRPTLCLGRPGSVPVTGSRLTLRPEV